MLQFSCKKHIVFVMSEGLDLMLGISQKASKYKITNGQRDVGSNIGGEEKQWEVAHLFIFGE